MSPIKEPYLLCVCVPVSIDGEGRRWTDELWAKDLELHLEYLDDLTLASPAVQEQPRERDVCLNQPLFDRLKYIDLPYPRSYGAALRCLPGLVRKLWSGARNASIVHSGFGGWPIAEGWLLTPIGKLQKKLVVTNMESSFWRHSGPHVSWRKKVLSSVMEQLTRFAVRIADLRFFTSKAYAAEFLPENAPRSFVVPATWLNEEWILSDQQAAAAWDAKQGATRLIFAGRLVAEKGVDVLLKAIDEASDARAAITIIGEGSMRVQCVRAAQETHGSVSLQFLDPVKYGEPFLAILRSHDAVLLPSLSSEQPRLLFDAFSQAVPVIGSATGGICEVVEAGVTGSTCTARRSRRSGSGSHLGESKSDGVTQNGTHRTRQKSRVHSSSNAQTPSGDPSPGAFRARHAQSKQGRRQCGSAGIWFPGELCAGPFPDRKLAGPRALMGEGKRDVTNIDRL